jgi:ATP-binding cassette subfamily C (CFTR/MRP) protein 1
MGYCAQTPWLQNGTIQQNICGFIDESDIDKVWYRTVLYACALEQDMALLDEGDQSMVGSKGVTLSGGQRQRVVGVLDCLRRMDANKLQALARAVYARLNIVLLDDVLSALDSNTERQIVERLLGANGMFRKLGTTVVLVTHSSKLFPEF